MLRLLALSFGFILAMAVAAWSLTTRTAAPDSASDKPPAATAQANRAGAIGDTVIAKDASGRFSLKAMVNGEEAAFLVDTGADMVALTPDDAERMGIAVDRDSFAPVAQTASGIGYGAPVRIDRIEIADQEFRDVQAVVIDGLKVNLLGQSLLNQLGQMELHGDRMVFRRS